MFKMKMLNLGERVKIVYTFVSSQTEGCPAVYHHCFDWDRVGFYQTYFKRQGQENLHDCHTSAGKAFPDCYWQFTVRFIIKNRLF